MTENAEAAYRAVHPLAVISAGLSIASVVALGHPVLLIVPIVAIGTGALAWRATVRNSEVWTGRKAAIAGIALAIMLGATGVSRFASRQSRLVAEADATAREFFDYLARDEVFKAHQLVMEPAKRLPLDDHLLHTYQNSTKLNSQLRNWTGTAAIHSLLFLGTSTQVRPYQTEDQRYHDHIDSLDRVYAVSFERNGRLRTFFIRLNLSRSVDEETGVVGWTVGNARAPVTPEGWPKATMK